MTVKDFLEMDIAEIAKIYDSKGTATKKAEPKKTESIMNEPDIINEEEAPTKYKGEGNPMKLRKMLKDRDIEAEAKKKAPYYVAMLLADDEAKASEKTVVKKTSTSAPSTSNKKLTEETYNKNETYTEEQLRSVTSRGLENICRKVFDIPRSELVEPGKTAASKDLCIKAILAVQGGGSAEEKGKYDGMKAKELYAECKERGINVPMKKEGSYYRDVLKANDEDLAAEKAAKAKKVEAVSEDKEEGEYAGLSAKELCKLCREKDKTVKIKQSREFYIDFLNSFEEEEEEADEEDWGEDVDEEVEDEENVSWDDL